MEIYTQHHGQQSGPHSIDDVRAGLAAGTYQPSDLAWYEGAAGWMPLSSIAGIFGSAPPPLAKTTSGLAISSLILGILAFPTLGLTGIPAVICGHLALRKIKRAAGTQTGGGLAIGGLVTGYFGFLVLGVAVLAGLAAPMIIRQKQKAHQTEAINNCRQIAFALMEFESNYGRYPDDSTAALVAAATSNPVVVGDSSNARLRQLFHAGIARSERMFYAKVGGISLPDERIDGVLALSPGECAFAYVDPAPELADTPRPMLMTPFLIGTDHFDPGAFAGKAVIMWSDGSVKSLPITRHSRKVMIDGVDLLDPANPVWAGHPPVIHLPE
jgi:hypothetical protein